ncbi:MAG TPA: hypothetical protein VFL53_19350 [Pseudolabrys sp.]|nr:hypothetical protein [Pseudolabrys sp.]
MRRTILLAGTATLLVAIIFYPGERNVTAQTSNQAATTDLRSQIALTDSEIAFIRHEMRGLLESIRDILDAAQTGDHARIAAAARRSGMNGPEAAHIPKSLASKLPPEFKKLGLATHRGFDQIALDAEQIGAADLTVKELGHLMENCVACHATWRLVDESKR